MRQKIMAILAGILFVLAASIQVVTAADAPASGRAGAFRVLDISERTYDNGPAIAVILSAPLDGKLRHDAHLRISDTQEMLKSAWVLSDDGRTLWFPYVDPEMEYSVTVLESLVSADGQTIGKRVSQTLTTRAIQPIISFASDGFLLPAKLTRGLPVVSVNVTAVYVEFFRLKESGLIQFVNWRNISGKKDYYQLAEAKKFGEMVFSGRFDLDAPKNRRTVCHIPVENIEALQHPGVYLAIMREPGQYDYNYQATYFLVTDIGLHVRVYDRQSMIFASSLKTGKPLDGVRLVFYDSQPREIAQGSTDADGRYVFSQPLPGNIHLITALWQDQVGVMPIRIPALDMSEFDLGKRPGLVREIFVYSPRNLYRPGETVTVSALLRDADGRPVDSMPLTARLFRPDGQEARQFIWHNQDLGEKGINYYQREFTIPSDARTGAWELRVWDDPGQKVPSGIFSFHVEEFLPERMKLGLKAEEPFPNPETTLKIAVEGAYLYGAPAAENTIAARVRVKTRRDLFDHLKGFEFGNIEDESYRDYWEITEQKLDKNGIALLEIPSRWQGMKSPLSVLAGVDLFETGGRPVTRSVEQIIWPAGAVIGIRPLFDEKGVDEGPVSFEIVRVKPDGTWASADDLMADVTREDQDYYWEYSEATGWQHKYTQKNYQYFAEPIHLEKEKPTPYTLQLPRGQYVLTVKDPATELITSVRFRVGHWWYGDDQKKTARPDKVVLTLDKPAYRPGDVIQLTVTPPHAGEALILVEGSKLLWQKRLPMPAEGTVAEIPILAGWDTHDIHISAVVFRPANAEEKITPNRAVGLIHLPLDRSDRKLKLAIESPEKVSAEGPVTVGIKLDLANEALSAPVFVTLACVDVGILNITDFKTPDPFDHFFGRRRFDVNAYDVYAKVIENMDGNQAALRYGGDADLTGGKRPETKVKLLSLFQGPVVFDKNGKASVTFDLPDFNGRVRLMAAAFTINQFGSAEKEMIVAAPVVTQLAMPRFLAPGDVSELTLDIHNLSGQAREIHASMTADGPVTLEKGQEIIRLSDGGKITVRFPVKAREDYGVSDITLKLTGQGIKMERRWSLAVRPGYPAIGRRIFKVLKENETFTLDPQMAADLIGATVEADIKISAGFSLDFQAAMKGLIGYPYGCLEQTTSQAYPLLFATPEQTARYNLPAITNEERIKRINIAVDRLSGMQLASGGFGLWDRNSPEDGWLTVHAANFLLTARDMGMEIPAAMLDNVLNRLEVYVKQNAPLQEYMENAKRVHLEFAVRGYAGYVLSRLNRAPLGDLRTLFDNHKTEADTCLPLAHLGISLKRMGDETRGQEALELAAAKRPEERNNWWGDYGSPIRDLAMTVALLMENKADTVKAFESLLLDLEKELRERQWLSTQEKYAIFKAGIALNERSGREWKGKITQTGKDTELAQQGPYFTALKAEDIRNLFTFTSQTPDNLYVSAVITGYTQTPPPPDVTHVNISRKIYDLQGNWVDRREFKVGELFLVHLQAAAKQWIPDALIADLLPAGFEVENQNLTHSFKLEDMKLGGVSDQVIRQLKENTQVLYQEYRDDRYVAAVVLNDYQVGHLFYLVRVVSPGTFSVPPAFAESMYQPEIRGVGDTPRNITVLNQSP
jgi:hypothetical protein